MKKFLGAAGLVLATILTAGCHIEVAARNGIAAAETYIIQTENQHPECAGGRTSPPVCAAIQNGIRAVNSSIVALDAYCEGTPAPGVAGYDQGGVCVPVKSASEVLQVSLASMNSMINAIKGVK